MFHIVMFTWTQTLSSYSFTYLLLTVSIINLQCMTTCKQSSRSEPLGPFRVLLSLFLYQQCRSNMWPIWNVVFMTMNSRLPTDTNDLENNENDSATHDADAQKSTIKLEDENIGSIRFYPPLFMQRYSFTAKVLEKHDVKWVSRSSYHGYICI